MASFIFALYVYSVALAYVATLVLVFTGRGWGRIPHVYLKAVLFLQSYFPKAFSGDLSTLHPSRGSVPWGDLIHRHYGKLDLLRQFAFTGHDERASLQSKSDSITSSASTEFDFLSSTTNDDDEPNYQMPIPFHSSMCLFQNGLEAVVQDELSGIFGYAPAYRNAELSAGLWTFLGGMGNAAESIALRALFLAMLTFRWFYLFPLRLALLLTSFAFLFACCTLALFIDFSPSSKTSIAVTYCKFYTASIGLIARYHNRHNQPKRPGFAISNHLSPNDIQIISADVDPRREYLFMVTGQRHQGVIWLIEQLVARLCPAIWLERSRPEERRRFSERVLEEAKMGGPVLIFPEGYCTNNSRVLQFRRAIFEQGVDIYPIAIRQDARLGDSYWSEPHFGRYLLRLLTGWAIIYDIHYMPPVRRMSGEDAIQFAARVQQLIAAKIQVPAVPFDGGVWYKDSERKKLQAHLEGQLARQVVEWLESVADTAPQCLSTTSAVAAMGTPSGSITDLSSIGGGEEDMGLGMEADSAIYSDSAAD